MLLHAEESLAFFYCRWKKNSNYSNPIHKLLSRCLLYIIPVWTLSATHSKTHTCLLVHLVAGCSRGVDRGDKASHWQGHPPPCRTRCSELAGSLKMTHSSLRHCGFTTFFPDTRVEEVKNDRGRRRSSVRCQFAAYVGEEGNSSEIVKGLWKDWKDKKSVSKLPQLVGIFTASSSWDSCYFSTPNKAMCRQSMQMLDGPSQPFCITSNANTLDKLQNVWMSQDVVLKETRNRGVSVSHKETQSSCKQSSAAGWWLSDEYE